MGEIQMSLSGSLLKTKAISTIKLECRIDLDQLLPTEAERKRFNNKWEAFLASAPCNADIFTLKKNCLIYQSEQLIPKKKEK